MERKFLNLIPKRYLCPYCGEWHDWNKAHDLGHNGHTTNFACDICSRYCSVCNYSIYFLDDYLHYSTEEICGIARQGMKEKVLISSIEESSNLPRVTFDVDFIPKHKTIYCSECEFISKCNVFRLSQQDDGRDIQHLKIKFGFEFEKSDYENLKKEQISHVKEDTNMTNNILNMNLEFGPNRDENLASTLMGVAVKNGDSWRIFDKKKMEITDVGNMQLGNLPIFILPTMKLEVGDLIKDAGEYYYVTKVATPNTHIESISARTGGFRSVVPIKNILGFTCYSKVIALSDSLSIGDDFDIEKLAIMSAMTGQNGGQMNQLLPLMLFKDELGGDDDKMKLLLMSSMMTSEGDQMNQLLPLMLFKDKLGGDDDKMKLLLMSSMMGGSNTAGSNNPLMGYLMLDTFMGK